ncbi:MAG: glutamate 5-kinase [Candidatus Kaelpia aquatica]|nr:glutamate 5-kinase [Candidatus Kaelpia aquatica]
MYKKIVIKIGSSILRKNDGSLDLVKFKNIAKEVSSLMDKNRNIVLVSSGAIASGMGKLGLKSRPQAISYLQALASLGQIELMKTYQNSFSKHKIEIGQVLLSWDDFSDRKRYLNAKDTIEQLIKLKIVPVINENDALAVEEIKFGDNDKLSAMVASLISADLLLILSDIDGIYDGEGRIIKRVTNVKDVKKYCFDTDKAHCVGGMITKLEAVEVAASLGIPSVITNGKDKDGIKKGIALESGTFIEAEKKLSAKKHWIAYLSKSKGAITVDAGAEKAVVEKGKSILPMGILSVNGHFGVGDLITVKNKIGIEIAKGISGYSSLEIEKIKGHKSKEIAAVLGLKRQDEAVHRDNLVLFEVKNESR